MNKSNISENDSRDYYLNQLVSKCGFQQITISKDEIYDKFIYKPSFNKYLKNRYPNITDDEIKAIIKKIEKELSNTNWLHNNRFGIYYLQNSIHIVNDKNESKNYLLYDNNDLENNVWEIAKEVWIGFQSRLDLVILMNGMPIYIFEMKSMTIQSNANIENAIKQLSRYATTNSKFFTFNIATIAMINELIAKVGSPNLKIEHWFKIEDINNHHNNIAHKNHKDKIFYKFFKYKNINNYIKNGILFEKGLKPNKIILKHHQLRASIKVIKKLQEKKGGLIWHTPGSGKTITICSIVSNALRSSGIGSTTFIIDVDRKDLVANIKDQFDQLDKQSLDTTIKTFQSRNELQEVLKKVETRGVYIVTTQKFSDDNLVISPRDDIVILSDEAHRTHKESKQTIKKDNSKNIDVKETVSYFDKMRQSFPNATLIGFTGSPIMNYKLATTKKFGDFIDIYDMKEAEDDEVITKINFNYFQIPFIENIDNNEELDSLKNRKIDKSSKANIIDLNYKRLNIVASEITKRFKNAESYHYSLDSNNIQDDVFKAMIAVNSIKHGWVLLKELHKQKITNDDNEIRLVASYSHFKEQQIIEYLKNQDENEIIKEFRESNSKYKILIVVDKCLTGYDVKNLRMLFIDKELKEHNLFQAIMRVNRVFNNKPYGIVVCFRPLTEQLQETLRTYRENTNDHTSMINSIIDYAQLIISNIKEFEEYFEIPTSKNCVAWLNDTPREIELLNKTKRNDVLTILDNIIGAKDLVTFKKEEKPWQTKLNNLKLLYLTYTKIQKEDQAILKLTDEQIELIHKNSYIDTNNCFYVISDLELDKLLYNYDIKSIDIYIKPLETKFINKIKNNKTLTKLEKDDLIEKIKILYKDYNNKILTINELLQKLVDLQKITNSNSKFDEWTKILMKVIKEHVKDSYKINNIKFIEIDKYFLNKKDSLINKIKINSDRANEMFKDNIKKILKDYSFSLIENRVINDITNEFYSQILEG